MLYEKPKLWVKQFQNYNFKTFKCIFRPIANSVPIDPEQHSD
jgi:hypothetical protein